MITIHLPSLKVQFNGNTDSTLENIKSTLIDCMQTLYRLRSDLYALPKGRVDRRRSRFTR
jgi:hypothetical protein